MDILNNLTIEDVKCWDFMDTTPAHRKHYYNKEFDVAAYISSGERRIQFYFNRRTKDGVFAICFSDNVIKELD